MTTYADSSALIAVCVPELFSKSGREIVRTAGQIPFNALHRLEAPNAFELLVGRAAITGHESRSIPQLQDDLQNQRLAAVSMDLDRVFADAI